MAAQKIFLNIIHLLFVATAKESAMPNVLKNYIHSISLKISGVAGNVVLLKKLDTTLLNLIDMTNILSQIMKTLEKFSLLKIY